MSKEKRKIKLLRSSPEARARREFDRRTDLIKLISIRLDESRGFLLRLEELEGDEYTERALKILKEQYAVQETALRLLVKAYSLFIQKSFGRKEDANDKADTQENVEPLQGEGVRPETAEGE